MTTKVTSACAARVQLVEDGEMFDAIAIMQSPGIYDVAAFFLCDKPELGPITQIWHYDILPAGGCITFQFANDPVGESLLGFEKSRVSG